MNRRMRNSFLCILILFGASACSPAPEHLVPALTERIEDGAGVLSVQAKNVISSLLEDYERETTHQIGVLTVKALSGESIEVFSLRAANKWRLGRKGVDNGILIVVAPNDRTARIELGRGFERYISDARAQEIMGSQMLPAFRKQQYALGIEQGVSLLMGDGRAFVVRR